MSCGHDLTGGVRGRVQSPKPFTPNFDSNTLARHPQPSDDTRYPTSPVLAAASSDHLLAGMSRMDIAPPPLIPDPPANREEAER